MFTLSEDTLKAIHQRLQDDMPAMIATVNSELTSPSFPIEQIHHFYDFIPTVAQLTDFPVVAIGDGPIDFDDDIGWSATGKMDFAVVIWCMDYDQRALAWKLRRTMIAVANVLLAGRSLVSDGGGWGVTLGKIEPGPVLGRNENPEQVIGMRALTFTVRDEQDA